MAQPLTCEGALLAMKESAKYSLNYSNYAIEHFNDALAHWNLNQDHLAIQDLISGAKDANVAAGYAGYGYTPFDLVGPWWWYFTNCLDAGEVTMSSILLAMLTADFEQLKKFVGIFDAYRVAIWNAPFDAEYYAAIARGFQKWP